MHCPNLHIEQQGVIKTVTFNRPACANALSFEFLAKIEACAHALREDVATGVVVFTGAGPHFSSGMDLKDPGGYEGPLMLRRRRT
jgi:enoyl-CoA hydratase